jgi:hypothetical protein
MPDRDALHSQVWEALRAAKPITRESGLQIANEILRPVDATIARQFTQWYEKNGAAVVEMINGSP